jgi:hypothetical protein
MPSNDAFPKKVSYMILWPNMWERRRLNKMIAEGRENLVHNSMQPKQYLLYPKKSVRELYRVFLECDLPKGKENKLEMVNPELNG